MDNVVPTIDYPMVNQPSAILIVAHAVEPVGGVFGVEKRNLFHLAQFYPTQENGGMMEDAALTILLQMVNLPNVILHLNLVVHPVDGVVALLNIAHVPHV